MIKDVHRFGSYLRLFFHAALTAASSNYLIRFAAAAVITMAEKLYLTKRHNFGSKSYECLTAAPGEALPFFFSKNVYHV